MDIKQRIYELVDTWTFTAPVSSNRPVITNTRQVLRDALAEIERLEQEVSDAAGRLVSANSHIDKLIREQTEILIGKLRLEFDGAGGGIDLVVDCE